MSQVMESHIWDALDLSDISFVSKGFPFKDQIEELFIVIVYCMYSQHVTLSTFSLISLFYMQHKHDMAYLC